MGRIDILSASAGSGKTHRMAYNYIRLVLDEPHNYRHILAVTFTNKATDELKGRIITQLHNLAEGLPTNFDKDLQRDGYNMEAVRSSAAAARNLILHDYNNFAVMTIDKFFQRIMRAFIRELGIDLNFNLEIKVDSLLEQAADRVMEDITTDENLYQWVRNYIGENLAKETEWNIRGEIVSIGKQIFNDEFKHSQICTSDKPELERLVATFAAKSTLLAKQYQSEAQRFVALMDQHGLQASDFKGGASRGLAAIFIQPVAAGKIVAPNAAALNAYNSAEWYTKKKSPANAIIDSIADELHQILGSLIDIYPQLIDATNTYEALSDNYRDFALLADLSSRLDDICAESDILPLAEVGDLISKLVADNDTPFIYEKAGNRYDYFMIDEFQDTSTMQWRNFVPLLHNALSQTEGSPVLLVGDVKQSIYRWRGGDWSLLAHKVAEEFGDVRSEPLRTNRRSGGNIVKFNNDLTECVLNTITNQLNKQLSQAEELGTITPALRHELAQMPQDAYNDFGQEWLPDKYGGYITVLSYNKNNGQPHPAIARIEELQSRGYRARDIAILVRNNKEAVGIAAQLLAYKNNPERDQRYIFDVVSQEALAINSSRSVQFILACMSLAVNQGDSISRANYNNFLSRPYECEIPQEEAHFLLSLSMMHPEEVFNQIVLHFPECVTQGEVPYIQALHSNIIEYSSHSIADTALFVKWWEQNSADKSVSLPAESDAITILTIHKAKGLAFKAVIIPYCSWALHPHWDNIIWAQPNAPFNTNDHIRSYPLYYNNALLQSRFSHSYLTETTLSAIDALNTLYVAITRAERELHIMVPTSANASTVGKSVREFAGVKEDGEMATYGTAEIYVGEHIPSPSAAQFKTYDPSQKVAVRYTHQRYDEDSSGKQIAPRDFGIVMHQAMEGAITREDIEKQLELKVIDGLITAEEEQTLRAQIDAAMENPLVAGWFDGSWESVKLERDIIANGHSRRPDRVMTRGEKAVVVDYKFGQLKERSHTKQIEYYVSLLRSMGYTDVSGYLWYITLGDIDQV